MCENTTLRFSIIPPLPFRHCAQLAIIVLLRDLQLSLS
jgi:hypothetical protein